MLVLSRQRDESIVIGDEVVITVVEVRGDKVRLGIGAPKGVKVHRREVYEQVRREEGGPETVVERFLREADEAEQRARRDRELQQDRHRRLCREEFERSQAAIRDTQLRDMVRGRRGNEG